jgi:hypothetical protein
MLYNTENKTVKFVTSHVINIQLATIPVKCYIWNISLYGTETWTRQAVDQKHLESFEMWCWRRMEKISWTDHVRNEGLLRDEE